MTAASDASIRLLRCAECYGVDAQVVHQTVREARVAPTPSSPRGWEDALLSAADVILIHAPATRALTWCRQRSILPALCYIDPPYASHRDYDFRQKHPQTGEHVSRVAFGDRWGGEIEAYLQRLKPILSAIYAVLADEGSLLLHVDSRAAPYLSIVCDEIFGMGERLATKNAPGFRNEVIWKYGLGGSSPRSWPRKHDNILWYSKGSAWYFDPPMIPATSLKMRGQLKKHPDVIDIPTINNMAKDRTGYPTQKPIELLEMLVHAHSDARQWVVDVFGGSGTTALAAFQTGRRAVLADVSDDAIAVSRQRLVEAGASVLVYRPPANQQQTVQVDPESVVWTCDGMLIDGIFMYGAGGDTTHRLTRDVYGRECIVARESL